MPDSEPVSTERSPSGGDERFRIVVRYEDAGDSQRDFARAAALGLTDTPRWLPCRFLYDARGSELFEEITRQPEYYLTNAESAILERHAAQIRDTTGPVTLIELGSGSARKTDHLLSAYTADGGTVRYVPVDVSESMLRSAGREVVARHPRVTVEAIAGRYETAFPRFRDYTPVMVMFLGSTIGNFNNAESLEFWSQISRNLDLGDFFLLGVDLVKDVEILEAAYNDAAGVTARFTNNLFGRMNRELGCRLDLDRIEHVARYNAEWQRMEIFGRFLTEQTVDLKPLDRGTVMEAGEQVMIEISRKFVLEDLQAFVECFGFDVRRTFTDDRGWFAEVLLEKTGEAL